MTSLSRCIAALGGIGLLCTAPAVAAAQARTGSVAGTAYDSLAHHALGGATIDLVPATPGTGTAASTTSDSLGHFEIDDVLPGAYVVGFFHPTLDSLGIEAPATHVNVVGGARTDADVAVPSAQRIRGAVCKSAAGAKPDSTGMLVGHVNDAITGNAVEDATVTAQWSVFSFSKGHVTSSIPTARATTSSSGWFAFCSLPSTVTISMQVTHGADSSGVVGVDVRPTDVTLHTFYIAKATVVTGELHGVVRAATNGPPIPDVELTVEGTGLTATSNDQGEFSLSQLPLGTQMLLARKVGFVPGEMAVDLLGSAPAHVELILPTMANLMDTVRVVATKVYSADDNGFLKRKTSATGYFFDADQVARIQPFQTTDLLRRAPSVRILESGPTRTLVMPSIMGGYCRPNFYIDGTKIDNDAALDLDMLVHPNAVAGIEIYTSPGDTPPEFQSGLSSCGAIAVWTQVPKTRRTP